ncbi:MAG TPA: ABC transporter ATP-binding protein [Anaerolineae bacterium]|nr:ABC transporter ATP-binding protein [Anaerolineae bacterium]
MIAFDRVTYRYPQQPEPVLHNLSLEIEEGEFLLVIGPSGAGKSTFLRCLNGLVPHFYGGTFQGRVRVADQDPIAIGPQGMGDLVGMVFQDPEAQFVVDTVEEELAFAMENFGLGPTLMRKRVEEVLDQLNIAHLRNRRISTLSGGEKQRVAIAAVLTLQPRVLALDEPTSQLDPQAAEEVLIALRQLNEDLGLTVVLSEHRLERVVQYADRVLAFSDLGAAPLVGTPGQVLAQVPLTPPLITLGRELGWQPLPLTIKEGRRLAHRLDLTSTTAAPQQSNTPVQRYLQNEAADLAIQVEHVWFAYNSHEALRGVSLEVSRGEFVALMGRNGSGKTTLLKTIVGLLKPNQGRVRVADCVGANSRLLDTQAATVDEIIRCVGYVPQNPGALLFKGTLLEELAFTRQGHSMAANPETDTALLARLGLTDVAERYPRDLSVGQRQRAALAAILVAEPSIILLDEPTRGLDYPAKEALAELLRELCDRGHTIVMATHDVELVASCADRVVLMAEGEIVVDGPARTVMSDSLVFASQINKLFRDPRFLTVEDVLRVVSQTGLERNPTRS